MSPLRVLSGGLGSRVLLATLRARTGRTSNATLAGSITFKAGSRTVGVVPVNTARGITVVTIPGSRRPPARYTAVFSGNGLYSSSSASGR